MTTLTEKLHSGGFLISEASGHRSRDNKVLITGQNLLAATVLGLISVGSASQAFAGTGNGVLTMDATNPVRTGAKVGAYTATCITAAANSGTFRVEDPDGYVLGDVAVAATFDDDIKFVIADGATDFIVGDKFTITIAAGSGKATQLNVAAQNGSQYAAGILLDAVDATSADKACVLIARDAEVIDAEIVWPGGITGPQKTAAIAQLAALGIVLRA
jgi:hypothetical protein